MPSAVFPSLPPATRRVLPVFLGLTLLGSWPMWLALALLRPPPLAVELAVAAGSFAPAFAAWMVSRLVAPTRELKVETGLTVRVPRWQRWWALASGGMALLVLASVGLSALAGTFPLDLRELSGARAALAAYAKESPAQAGTLTPATFLAWQVARSALLGPLFFAPLAFGHEWGFRGWLLPRLLPLGRPTALLLSGALWGVWLTPLALQGYSYPGHPALGPLLLVITGTLLGALLGWLRLASKSLWPAVVAHGVLCASVGTALKGTGGYLPLLASEGAVLDAALVGPTGWPGWLGMAALGVVLRTRSARPG